LVASFSGNPYCFTFQSSLCLALSLSKTTLAAGFCDGSFILASLEDRAPKFTLSPFRAPIKSVAHVTDEEVTVQWCEVTGLVSEEGISWVKLPNFPKASLAAFGNGILALGTAKSLDIYGFAERQLLAQVPQRVIGVCMSGRHIYTLTIKYELIALYVDGSMEISVDHQSIIDVDGPLSISAVDETVYVLCERYVALLDMRGHRLDRIAISEPPRFFEAAQRGCFVVFSRMIRYLSRDHSTHEIEYPKSNLTAFSAIDDDRFCITTSNHLVICDGYGSRYIFSRIAKLTKRVLSLKCFHSHVEKPIDRIMALFDDDTTETWPIPAPRDLNQDG
jgi:hypothetical protein